MSDENESLNRWRLILGKYAKEQIDFNGSNKVQYMDMEEALEYVYGREYGDDVTRQGDRGATNLTIPRWVSQVKKLFPKETVEIIQHHALDKYDMKELIIDPRVLKQLEPDRELLKTILSLKDLMKGEVLETAKEIVEKVAKDIQKQLEMEVKKSCIGKIDRTRRSYVKSMHNFDIKKTIKANLKNYDNERKKLMLKELYFNSNSTKYNDWNVIICVDESGSMLDSVIHSAIMAGIFAKMPMISTKLIIFDTKVVDLSDYIEDVVTTLMSVQLGGGTYIANALRYAETLIVNPHRTMVVLVTDLFEGGSYSEMYAVSKNIVETGAKLITLTSLDHEANPSYDVQAANKMADIGASVGAMTPLQLADFVGKIIQGAK